MQSHGFIGVNLKNKPIGRKMSFFFVFLYIYTEREFDSLDIIGPFWVIRLEAVAIMQKYRMLAWLLKTGEHPVSHSPE